jgi:hypothetical protein
MFLTSANVSNKWEIYKIKDIKKEFEEHLKKWIIKFLWEEFWDLPFSYPSEIFEFEWNTLKQIFLRK